MKITLSFQLINTFPYGNFIIKNNGIIPMEVKSGENVGSISLKKYKEKYNDNLKLRVRFSMQNLKLDKDFLNIPCLWLIVRTD